nr:endonuclease [Microbulbifer sp. Q7]
MPALVFAHGGGLNAEGCHNDRKRGEYHCHRSANVPTPSVETASLKSDRNSITTFSQAKRVLSSAVYREPADQVAFYSGCAYHRQGKKLVPDWTTCGYKPRKNANRGSRIEWEHVVPAWVIGHQRQCWQTGGRKSCSRNDELFRMAEADMHNLVPAIGELNGDRSNYRFTELGDSFGQYGNVEFKVDFKQRAVQPPANRKGDIARTYLYMADTYGLSLSRAQKRLFEAWNWQDPVDLWECERERRIKEVQSNSNTFVSENC